MEIKENSDISHFWNLSVEEVFKKLKTSAQGLSTEQVLSRRKNHTRFFKRKKKGKFNYYLFFSQFNNPLIFLLISAALMSAIFADAIDATIILIIIFVSALLSFFQENKAMNAVEKLLQLVKVKTMVLREGKESEISVEKVVPGDIVLFNAGDVIPGDCLIIDSKDFYVDESSLTGESYSVEKKEGVVGLEAPINKRTNSLFLGTHVLSGTAKAVVVLIGEHTEFGKISERLQVSSPETDFEKRIRQFGYFLLKVTLVLVVAIFIINLAMERSFLESFLFSLALAVGLTPQLLPAIISLNLAQGAMRMAKSHVIVKKLNSIENFGSMNVLCTDKTGTLTKGEVEFKEGVDVRGAYSERVHLFAFLNASFQSGYSNPIDVALLKAVPKGYEEWKKEDEVPYDFLRRRITILATKGGEAYIITKGAFSEVLSICTHIEEKNGKLISLEGQRLNLEKKVEEFTSQGIRILALAYKNVSDCFGINKESEKEMIFLGFLLFVDPLKPDALETLQRIKSLGISLKIITGDHHLVALNVAQKLGFSRTELLTGKDIQSMSDIDLQKQINKKNIFAEVDPKHKERIILALKKAGHVVGYVGDGINDATALHTADVGISIHNAVDVARAAADIVLLKKDLAVLARGVVEGRRTFANTMKYIFMATSANFGNMFSMAGTSLFLNFLPLLPKQVLLTNLMTDVPEMTIASDHVDPEMRSKPLKWNLKYIRKFMIIFGLISSLFDFLTFAVLLFFFKASVDQLRTGWFVESVMSASLIILMIRTKRPFFLSRPSMWLLGSVLGVIAITAYLPFSPLARLFGFTPIPLAFFAANAGIVALYALSVEIAKRFFYPHNHVPKNLNPEL